MTIKILSPLNGPEEVESLVDAGTDEFYCGFLPSGWRQKYTVAACLNRRQEDDPTTGASPHIKDFAHYRETLQQAHSRQRPVFLTLNEHYYDQGQYAFLRTYVEQALQAGTDGFIVGDIGLLRAIQQIAPQATLHISTAGTAFNSEAVHFYRDLGAARVILPRHLSLEEIETIARHTEGIELEAFILNSRCANVDGFCTFQHGLAEFIADVEKKRDYENACMMLYNISADVRGCGPEEAEQLLQERVSWERQHFWSAMHIDERPCGVCALHEFEAAGLAGVKIVGRGNTTQRKVADVAFVSDCRNFLCRERPSKQAFRQYVRQRYQAQYDRPCLIFKCYYPSVLLGEAPGQQRPA